MQETPLATYLTSLARGAIAEKLGMDHPAQEVAADPLLQQRRGLFVTLKLEGELRGCIGSLQGTEPLRDAVRRQAVNAAFHDQRFRPLTAAELPRVRISVSVLTEPRELTFDDPTELRRLLRPQLDGVILRHPRGQSATFLPQVWSQIPQVDEFLAALARKAGLPAQGWRDGGVRIWTYQADVSEEDGHHAARN